jgi:hypothetical protein
VKINLVSLTMFSVGALLIYSGVKDFDPRDVVSWALGGKKPMTMHAKKKDAETPKVNPKEHPGDKNYPPGTEDGGEPTVPAVYV